MRVVIPQIAWHARDPVLTLDFDPKGKTEEGYYRLASGGADNLLLIWHLKNPDTIKPEIICVSELKRHQKAINVCRFSPCGNYIASGDDDSYVFIWKNESITEKEETWNVEKILRRHVEDVSDLSWSPDGNFLVSGSVDNSAVLWDIKKGTAIHFWPDREHTGFVQGVAYDPLGEFSATMCIDRNLRFFNNKTGKVMHKTLKYPPAWLGGMEDDDTTKENKPEVSEQPESNEQSEVVKKIIPDIDQPENIEDKDKPLGEINGMDEDEIKLPLPPKKPVTTLNRLFHDDTLKTFCRRLSCSPRGELLMVPGGLLPPVEKIKEESQSRHSSPVEDEDSKDKILKRFDPEQNNAVIIFCRNSWTNPCAIIPTGLSYSIAARFSTVYYNREREPYEYDEEFINSNKRSERIVSCIARLRAPKKEAPVLLDMPYRLVYAVATNDSILIGDTASIEPLACIKNIHCTRMTDIAWSPDGLVLVASSTDGYCSLLTFDKGELGAEFVAAPEEFPSLTPTCFPIAPPEPKPVKIKKEKEPKEPKEPKEKKEKKEKIEKVEKEPATPAEEKETKKKAPLTITKMFSAANASPTTPSLKSPAVAAITTPVAQLGESSKPESSAPDADASETMSTPTASTPKPTFLDSWVKKTPKSSTSEPKPPRRIQLTTLASPSTSSPLAKTLNTAPAISNGVSEVLSSPKVTSIKQPRRIPLVRLDDDSKPMTQSDTASTCEPSKPVKCSVENVKEGQNQVQKAPRRITPILVAATEKKESSTSNLLSNGTAKKLSIPVNGTDKVSAPLNGIPNGPAVKSNSQEGNLQNSEASSTSTKTCEHPEPMDCAYAEKSAKVKDLEPPVLKIQTFLKDLPQGFILVNIGCASDTVRNLPYETLTNILNSLRASSLIKFVFMWDTSFHAGLQDKLAFADAKNILLMKKCSSEANALLAHPDIKGLITHGDLLDIHEAIYHAIPMIVLPVVLEQDSNAERISRLRRGIRLEITSLVEEDLTTAINELLTNDIYKINMKQASTQFKDRQVKPLENAMWWIEYVLRNPDVSALKPRGIYQPWYLRRSIDVWLLIVCITLIVFVSLLGALAMLCKSRYHQIHLNPNFISEVEDYKGKQKHRKHD